MKQSTDRIDVDISKAATPAEKNVVVGMSLPPSTLQKIREMAKSRRKNVSRFNTELIESAYDLFVRDCSDKSQGPITAEG